MELRHLRYFMAVAEELHFGRAAERLNMAQPPLSQQVRALEDELGVRLFERSSRRVRLTEAGEIFEGRARRILESADMAVDEARRAARGELGRVTVGIMSSAMLPTFPPILRHYRAGRPDVEVAFAQLHSNEQLDAVREGRIDVGFVDISARGGRTDVNGVAVHVEPVWRETLVAALPREHPLAGRARIGLAELADDPFIMMPRLPATGLYDRVIQFCQDAGFNPAVRQEAQQLPVVVTLVAAGVGVALVPGCVAEPWREALAFVPVREPIHIDVTMIRRADNSSSAVTALEDSVRAMIAGLPAGGPVAPIPLTRPAAQPVAAE
jgi:DNA-binding transcriptional LysR family regulator